MEGGYCNMIIADIAKALRPKYKVDTVLVNKEAENHISVVLAAFDPMLETPTSYLPEIEVDIIFYGIDGDALVEKIKDIIQLIHADTTLANYHHFRFERVDVNPTNNDFEIKMVIKYRERINLG
jgi:hypothetical protein